MKILVIGDLMIDHYTFVSSERKAPEADIPVWDEKKHEIRLGGASNVANNLRALDEGENEIILAGIVGSNDAYNVLKERNIDTNLCFLGGTLIKHRYVDEKTGKFVARFDNMKSFSQESVSMFETMVSCIAQMHSHFDAVIVSDYDKGTITENVMRSIKKLSPFIFVDSKKKDLRMFEGSFLIKLNEEEYSQQVSSKNYTNVESLFKFTIVTRGGKDSLLKWCTTLSDDKYIVHEESYPIEKVKASDVTGCGDTHIAAFVFSYLKNRDERASMKFANKCASQVVGKFGTSTV